MTTSSDSSEGIERARRVGREAAELFDRRLREVETAEREQRLATLAWRPQAGSGDDGTGEDAIRVVQLEARVSELTAYVKAVNESRPWRMIQWFRRLMGRSW